MIRLLMIILAVATLASCTKVDPSKRDLRSPCAATGVDFTGKQPCVKRFPSDNVPMLA